MVSRRAQAAGAAAAVACCCFVFFSFFDPNIDGWFPKCPLFVMTGLQCPGCGSTRAVHALMHGRIADAFAWNPYTMSLLVLGVIKLLTPPLPARARLPVALVCIAVGLAFAVHRNVMVAVG